MKQTHKVLITGASSGIGKALLQHYALHECTTVVAAIFEGSSSQAAASLRAVPKAPSSNIVVIDYDAASTTAPGELVKAMENTHNIWHLDLIIACAAILDYCGSIRQVPSDSLQEHLNINALAPIYLFQSCAPLLDNATSQPKFVMLTSMVSSQARGADLDIPVFPYALSKAMLVFTASRLQIEEGNVVVIAIDPGVVATRLGSHLPQLKRLAKGMASMFAVALPEERAEQIAEMIKRAQKEIHGGKVIDCIGKELPM